MSTESPLLLDIPEVAAILRSSLSTVYRLLNTGELEGKRVRSKWRITRPALARYLDVEVADLPAVRIEEAS
jgi:excisionase family DNA binding protein